MKFLYDLAMYLLVFGFRAGALFDRKLRLGYEGRRDVFEGLRKAAGGERGATSETAGGDAAVRWIWFHAASLGEFEQGRPLIEEFRKRKPEYKILLTFFSPSGYEIRKNYPGADHICYLPVDTPANARKFIGIVKPEIAVFIKYEFWLNYIRALKRSGARVYVVSAIFRPGQIFFKRYGGIFRKTLRSFDRLFVQDKESQLLLAGIGADNAAIAGDTRFDRVTEIASNRTPIPAVEDFIAGRPVLVAGSTWPQDEALLKELQLNNPHVKFIIAPHETGEERVTELAALFGPCAVRYTGMEVTDSLAARQVLVVDTVGLLSSLYGYGKWAYVGGGFGVGIHNTLEAAVYGIPVAFGPNYEKFREARDLVRLGGAVSVKDARELAGWFSRMQDETLRLAAGNTASAYVRSQSGSTSLILDEICK